eukprot:274717_1
MSAINCEIIDTSWKSPPTIITICITTFSGIVSLILLSLFAKYLWLKYIDPDTFVIRHVFGSPSIHLFYYMIYSHVFLTICAFYIFLCQFITAYNSWSNSCQHSDENKCLVDDPCNPTSLGFVAIIVLQVIGFFILIVHVAIIYIPWYRYEKWWIQPAIHHSPLIFRFDKDWKPFYLKSESHHTQFLGKLGSHARRNDYILYYLGHPLTLMLSFYPIAFLVYFTGFYSQYVMWYTLFLLLILSVSNEVIKGYIYPTHSDYRPRNSSLYLLTKKFGKKIANLIFVVYLNENNPIYDFEGVNLNPSIRLHRIVVGYIRSNIQSFVPNPIQKLIVDYYNNEAENLNENGILLKAQNAYYHNKFVDTFKWNANVLKQSRSYYFEIKIISDCGYTRIGWIDSQFILPDPDKKMMIGDDIHSVGYSGDGIGMYGGNEIFVAHRVRRSACIWSEDDHIGCGLNIDKKQCEFYLNGESVGIITLNDKFAIEGNVYPAITLYGYNAELIILSVAKMEYYNKQIQDKY